MPLIKFSGRATFNGRTYRHAELGRRVRGMDMSPTWCPSPSPLQGDFLFCSETARRDYTRTIQWFVQIGNPIYDFSDLFDMWMSSDEARAFAGILQIDMPNESSRIAAKARAATDVALAGSIIRQCDETPDYPLYDRLRDRRAASDRVRLRQNRGITYETIPRLGEAIPRDMVGHVGEVGGRGVMTDEQAERFRRTLIERPGILEGMANAELAPAEVLIKTKTTVTYPRATIERPMRRIKF